MPSTYTIASSALIPAPAAVCYDVIADYRTGHPTILPKPWFGPLTVEAGGVGAGTRIRFEMTVLGKTRVGHAEVTEPVPGHVLMETDEKAGIVTTFTVEHVGRSASRVTIATQFSSRVPWLASAEQAVVGRLLRRIYEKELALLDERVGDLLAHGAGGSGAATAPLSMGMLPGAPSVVS
jgi:hypothetical protein